MLVFIKKYETLLIAILILVLGAININVATLCFIGFWQFASIRAIVYGLRLYKKTRTGKFTIGQAYEVRKIPSTEEAAHNYEYAIKFHWPLPENEYYLKHQFSSLLKPTIGKQYKIWVNEDAPDQSILMAVFKESWWSLAFFV